MLTRNCLCTSCLCWWILNLQHPQQREYNCTLTMSCTLATALSHWTLALYSRLCLSHCTLGSVDSLYPHFCTYTLAFCSDPALCSRLSFLYSRLCVLSRCTLNSVHCTLVSLQSRLSVSRTALSTLCTLVSLYSRTGL